MLDLVIWAIGGTLLGGGGLKGAEVYLTHRTASKVPELTEEERFKLELETPLTEPEKTLPEHCSLFIERLFEKRLLDEGVIKREEMSICMDGRNCPECGPDARWMEEREEHRREVERKKRRDALNKIEAEQKARKAKAEAEKREQEHRERMSRYEREKWQAVRNEQNNLTGHIREIGKGNYEYESMATGKRKVIPASDARRYCKTCWLILRKDGECRRGCDQPIPAGRKRSIEGYMISVPEEIPFDAFGKVDRTYRNEHFLAVGWKWIDKATGETKAARSLSPRPGFEGREPTAIERAAVAKSRPPVPPRGPSGVSKATWDRKQAPSISTTMGKR